MTSLSELIKQIGPDYQTLAQSGLWQGEVTQVDLENLVLDIWPVLQGLHDQNRVYGVFSLETILLDRAQRAHLLSFSEEQLTHFRANNEFAPGYAAFELHAADPGWPIGPWTDVYGLGMVLRSMVLKQEPVSAMTRMVKDNLTPLSGDVQGGGFTRRFLRAIDCATILEPEVRTQSLNELVLAMGLADASEIRAAHPEKNVPVAQPVPALGSTPASTPVSSPVTDKAALSTTAAATGQDSTEPPARKIVLKERRRGSALGIIALVLAAAAAGVYVFTGQEAEQSAIAATETGQEPVQTRAVVDNEELVKDAGEGNKLPQPLWETQDESVEKAMAQAEMMSNAIAGKVSETLDTTLNETVNDAVNSARVITEENREAVSSMVEATDNALAGLVSSAEEQTAQLAVDTSEIIQTAPDHVRPDLGITQAVPDNAQAAQDMVSEVVNNSQETPEALAEQSAVVTTEASSIDGEQQRLSAAEGSPDTTVESPQNEAALIASQTQQEQKRLEAERLAQEKRKKEQERASLAVVSFSIQPWGDVYVDSRRRGASPPLRSLRLSPGSHTIEIRNGNLPSHVVTVELESQQKATISHQF